jgi:YggT family protein
VEVVCVIIKLYLLVLVARAITSFFPVTPGTAFAQIVDVLYKLTEPVLGPLRRVIPPLGMFDLSFLVVVIAIQVFASVIGCPGGLL